MKYEIIKACVYEIGDVLDISEVKGHTITKMRLLDDANKCLVIGVKRHQNGDFSYRVVTDRTDIANIIPAELGAEKYLQHFDLPEIFCKADERTI